MDRNFPAITPGLLYHNASEMIEWLCRTFDFKKKLVIPGDEGKVLSAHLIFSNTA
ncbi:hypothetical protein [Niabella aurantiaca]|uniref:hypothetical protein n=1 Tax=Niabella aurantiaca TaxID=379900 RepID=UPI0003A53B62|nr:hypothetical protein [Niabella aurantiaca]